MSKASMFLGFGPSNDRQNTQVQLHSILNLNHQSGLNFGRSKTTFYQAIPFSPSPSIKYGGLSTNISAPENCDGCLKMLSGLDNGEYNVPSHRRLYPRSPSWLVLCSHDFASSPNPALIRTASLQQPPLNNTQYRAFLSPVLPNLRGFKITPKSVMEDTEQNKIIIHCSSVADVVVGGKVAVKAGYKNEYIIIFWFNKDGKKITRMVEFVDGLGIGKKMGVMLGTVKGKL